MIATLFFFSLKMSITAVSFYWRHDTPSFVPWQSRLATTPATPRCIVIQNGQFTGGVHAFNQFVREIVSPLPCLPALVHHTLLIVYFFQRTYFFHCLPWQMPHQQFKRFEFFFFFLGGGFENIVGKCWLPGFSAFLQCFEKVTSYTIEKLGLCGKGLKHHWKRKNAVLACQLLQYLGWV